MEDKNKVKIYKIIMLIILVVFITFLLTSIGMYQYFTKNGINSRIAVVGNEKTTDLANTLNQYGRNIRKFCRHWCIYNKR